MRVEPEAPFSLFGRYDLNMPTLYWTWAVMAFLFALAWLGTRKLERYPGKLQVLLEMAAATFDNLCQEALGERGRKYTPYVGTLFLLIWFSNMVGVLPFAKEPTSDINTPVALAAVAIVVAQVSAIVVNGVKGWFTDLCEPAPRVFGVPIPLLLPLNIVGEVGKAISLPFRLFGNIFGGSVIILVVGTLTMYIGLPPFLNFFFGIFVGTIQALVFTMLALTYVAVAIGGEDEFEDEPEAAHGEG